MISANAALFKSLTTFCDLRNDPVTSPEAVRFVTGDSEAKGFLQRTVIVNTVLFGRHRGLAHLRKDSTDYIALVGFEFAPPPDTAFEVDTNAGVVVALLSELPFKPSKPPAVVRDIVEVGDKRDPGYVGHDAQGIEILFPSIRLFELTQPIGSDSVWQHFLQISASECVLGGSWISDRLADELCALSAMDMPSLPYEALSRSMFDMDPRGLYMALYRCVEATYAFESCRKLVQSLHISLDWHQLAAALEREVAWHPREASSLNLVLAYAEERDLQDICDCLKRVTTPAALAVDAGRAIYDLRNRIVHYRPGHDTVDVDSIDWNQLCVALIRVVFSVFGTAFGYAR